MTAAKTKPFSVQMTREEANEVAAILRRYQSIANGIGDTEQSAHVSQLLHIFVKAGKS